MYRLVNYLILSVLILGFTPTCILAKFRPINKAPFLCDQTKSKSMRTGDFTPNECEKNHAPTVALTLNKLMVKVNSQDLVVLIAEANDIDNDKLIYHWTASGGKIMGVGNQISWESFGVTPGEYQVSVKVTDSCKATASDSRIIRVEPANQCPTVSLLASPTSLREGLDEAFHFTAKTYESDGIQYTWSSTRGVLVGKKANMLLNITGLTAGSIIVTVTVSDGRCSSTDSTTVNILPRPAPLKRVEVCQGYTENSTNPETCESTLNDVGKMLSGNYSATLIIEGHSDKKEKPGTAKLRADRVKRYLVEKYKIDAEQEINGNKKIDIRVYDSYRPDSSGEPSNNRRLVLVINRDY